MSSEFESPNQQVEQLEFRIIFVDIFPGYNISFTNYFYGMYMIVQIKNKEELDLHRPLPLCCPPLCYLLFGGAEETYDAPWGNNTFHYLTLYMK